MKQETIKKTREFKRVYRWGSSYASKYVVLYVYRNDKLHDRNRVGYSVSKKVGNAVTRNRIKRLFREVYRLSEDKLDKGFDLIFIARHNAAQADFHQIKDCIFKLYRKADIIKDRSQEE